MKHLVTAGLAALSLGLAAPAPAQDGANYILSTASTGGTYYPVGVAIATLTKVRLEPSTGIGMSAISSAGSGENVRLLREGEAQFGILQGLFGYFAATGTGPVEADGAQEHLRSVTLLWPNVEHFILDNEHVSGGTFSDFLSIKGMTAGLGRANSGTIGSNAAILANFDLDAYNDFDLVDAGYGPTVEALQNGQADGVSIPAGPPVGAVSQLLAAAGDDVTVLNFTDEELAQADGDRGLWFRYVIASGTYPGQDADIETIAQPNFLATHADIPDDHVYEITKTIYENLPFLQAIHPATNAMSLEVAISGLPVPLHPGAARFYQEQGIEIPERLIAN
ncbi:MAG: TAXI family TRAP transporter solute-binding subunit [Pseudomonadota bacterium]